MAIVGVGVSLSICLSVFVCVCVCVCSRVYTFTLWCVVYTGTQDVRIHVDSMSVIVQSPGVNMWFTQITQDSIFYMTFVFIFCCLLLQDCDYLDHSATAPSSHMGIFRSSEFTPG